MCLLTGVWAGAVKVGAINVDSISTIQIDASVSPDSSGFDVERVILRHLFDRWTLPVLRKCCRSEEQCKCGSENKPHRAYNLSHYPPSVNWDAVGE